jgi:hypothetical protein
VGWGWDYVKELASRAEHLGGEAVQCVDGAANATVEGFERAGRALEDQLTASRPQGTSGHDIYLMFHGPAARGTGSIDGSVAGWRRVSGFHQQAGDALQSATNKLGIAWQGATAESAGASVVRLREAADSAGQQALHAGNVLEAQSSAWNDTAHKVTNVPPEPPHMTLGGLDPITPVLSHSEATAYTAGQQANQRALSGYGSSTSTNTQQAPQFAAPAPKPSAQQAGALLGSGSMPGTSGPVHSGQLPAGGGGAQASSTVDSRREPAATHSSWQVPDVMQHHDGGQATPQQAAVPVAGVAAGAAGVIAGGSALMGSVGTVGGSSIGARLAGGGSAPGLGSSGSTDSGRTSGSGGLPDEERETASRGAGSGAGSGAPGARGRKEPDEEHQPADYLVEANPNDVFGQGRQVAPPVLGDEPEPAEAQANGD